MKIDSIWKEYKMSNDKELKNQLIENYISLVKIVAGRMYNFYGSKIDFGDLVGYGILGLIDSIDKFDITKDIKFETYAQIRIRGEIIDNIRKLDWVPRSVRTKSKEVQDTMYKLENKLGRKPDNREIAEALNISVMEVEDTLSDMVSFNVSSLEEMLVAQGDYAMDIPGRQIATPEEIYEANDLKDILIKSIDDLDEREKLVISLYYYEELTYREIGEVLDLSESRISQIHSKAIIHMKNILAKQGITEKV